MNENDIEINSTSSSEDVVQVIEDVEENSSTSDSGTVEVISVEPLNSAGLSVGQTHIFAVGFFVLLMVIYFVCQRGSYDGRSS